MLNNLTKSVPTDPRLLSHLSPRKIFLLESSIFSDLLNMNHMLKYVNYGSLKG